MVEAGGSRRGRRSPAALPGVEADVVVVAAGAQEGGVAAQVARERGIARFHLSLSHCRDYAVAMVVAEGERT